MFGFSKAERDADEARSKKYEADCNKAWDEVNADPLFVKFCKVDSNHFSVAFAWKATEYDCWHTSEKYKYDELGYGGPSRAFRTFNYWKEHKNDADDFLNAYQESLKANDPNS